MEPISASANVIAFVSLAIQLAQSTKQLYDFWASIKDAPKSIRRLTDDLRLVDAVLEEIEREGRLADPDATCLKALQSCQELVANLNSLADDLAPGFSSSKRHFRAYTALRAVGRSEKIQKFRSSLADMKSTLTLIQQRMLNSLVREHHASNEIHQHKVQESLATVNINLKALHIKYCSSFPVESAQPQFTSDVEMHNAALRTEIDRATSKLTPVYASICKRAIAEAFDQTLPEYLKFQEAPDLKDQERIVPRIPDREEDISVASFNPADLNRQWSDGCVPTPNMHLFKTPHSIHKVYNHTKGCYHREVHSPFGRIKLRWSTSTWQVSNPVFGEEEDRHQHQISIIFCPSRWLQFLGLNEGIHICISNSSARGWKFTQTASRPVPDNSPIFRLCREGNAIAVKELLKAGTATIWDTDSHSLTPLIFAAGSCRYELCKQLIAAGASTSPVGRHITVWSYWQSACSALTAAAGGVDHDETYWNNSVQDRIATLRLLVNSADIDLSEPNSVGWIVLGIQSDCVSMEWPGKNEDAEIAVFKNVLHLLLSYGLLEDLHDDMVKKLVRRRSSPVLDVLMDTSSAFLETSPTIISEAIHLGDSWFLEGFFKRGADLHQAVLWGGHWNTPTSSAMRTLDAFSKWQRLLEDLGVNVREFVHEELQQKQVWEGSGWTKESLLRLFESKFLNKRRPSAFCEYCLIDFEDFVDTVWMQVLSTFMQGLDLYNRPLDTHPRVILGGVVSTTASESGRILTISNHDILYYRHPLHSSSEATSSKSNGTGNPFPAEASAGLKHPPPTNCSRIGVHDQICQSCWLRSDPAKPYCHWKYDFRWICYDCWMSDEKPVLPEYNSDSDYSDEHTSSTDENDSPLLLSI